MSQNLSHAYRTPDVSTRRPPWNPRALRAFAAGLVAFAAAPLSLVASAWLHGDQRTLVMFVGAVASFAGAVVALVGALNARREVAPFPLGARGRALATAAILLGVTGVLFSMLGAFAAWVSTMRFVRGRQVRRRGIPVLSRVVEGAAWAAVPTGVSVVGEVRVALAARWRENGRSEHASVAAFAQLTLDLMALGAPPTLVAAAQRDALDEIRHAELCFSLARALDGRAESPGPFPAGATTARSSVRAVALAGLAVDSLVDGALHEGVSARVIAQLAKRCEEPAIRAVLKELAADEGRHAAHGWDVVDWCLAEGGMPVASALLGGLRALPATLRSPRSEAAMKGEWERWGIHGHALEAEEFARARADLIARVERRVARERALAPRRHPCTMRGA